MKRVLPLFILAAAIGVLVWRLDHPCTVEIASTYQSGWSGSFAVRIDRIPATCGFAGVRGDARYDFWSKTEADGEWRRFLAVDFGEAFELTDENIIIRDDTSAVAFYPEKIATTIDRGRNWRISEIDRDFGMKNWASFGTITNVHVNGRLIFLSATARVDKTGRQMEVPFISEDFGMTWKSYSK